MDDTNSNSNDTGKSHSDKPKVLAITTAVLGVVIATFMAVGKYYEVTKVAAEAEKAKIEADLARNKALAKDDTAKIEAEPAAPKPLVKDDNTAGKPVPLVQQSGMPNDSGKKPLGNFEAKKSGGLSAEELKRRVVKGDLAIVTMENGSTLPLKQGNKYSVAGQSAGEWKTIPAWLSGRSLRANRDTYAGVAKFTVEKDGIVVMVLASYWKNLGNHSGGWYEECKSREDLLGEGWTEIDAIPLGELLYPVFGRDCRKGESFKIRTAKYFAPIIIQ